MDKPADPSTPFAEVYQSFLDDLVTEGTKPSTIHRYRYNIVRFEKAESVVDERHLSQVSAALQLVQDECGEGRRW